MYQTARPFLKKFLFVLSALHFCVILMSYYAEQSLPALLPREDCDFDRATTCYWENVVFLMNRCGENVPYRFLWELFYNYWNYVWFLPLFSIYLFSEVAIGFNGDYSLALLAERLILAFKCTILAFTMLAPLVYLVWAVLVSARKIFSRYKQTVQ